MSSNDSGIPPLPGVPPPPPPGEEALTETDLGRSRFDTRPEEVLASRTQGVPLSVRDSKQRIWAEKGAEDRLSKEDWANVYKAYEATGNVKQLGEMTNLTQVQVRHLLHYGIQRLGLRPVREAATDFAEVARRSEELLGEAEKARALQPREKEALIRHMPDVEQAITDRAVRETVAAQGSLLTCVRATDVMLGYVNKLLEQVQNPDGGYNIPEKVGAGHLESMAKAVAGLANATAKAIEQSRLAAGEPTQHIAVQVAGFVSQLSSDELRRYVETKELPSHMLLRGGSRDAVEDSQSKATSLPVIEASIIDEDDDE